MILKNVTRNQPSSSLLRFGSNTGNSLLAFKFNSIIMIFLLVALSLSPGKIYSQDHNQLAQQLFVDISDDRLDDFKPIEAAFILSGVRSEKELSNYVSWYEHLVKTIKDFRFDTIERLSSARKVFNYIRTTLYDEYEKESTTLIDIVDKRKYNCVSATILYNLVCEELGMTTQAFETPTHVYTIFSEFGKQVAVENTHPMGFDIMRNLDGYSKYLAGFYPENQVYSIGLDRLYAYENSKGRLIDNTELLGLLAYNQAYFAMEKRDYKKAYDLVLVAQNFNRDSRSNIQFEMRLYDKWGKQCFEEKRFYDAFEVLADGVYRYPENKGLAINTRTAFFNTLRQNRQTKNWPQTGQIIEEILQLDILNENDGKHLAAILGNWQRHLIQQGASKQAKEVGYWLQKLVGYWLQKLDDN